MAFPFPIIPQNRMEFQKMSQAAVEKLKGEPPLCHRMPAMYKLIYFDIKGLGEPVRFMLSYLGKDFEDVRVSRQEWMTMKKDVLFGKLPVLEIGDKVLYQSTAIMRYLAKESDIGGSNDWENLQIDVIVGTLMDLINEAAPAWCDEQPELKERTIKKLKNELIPYYMGIYNKLAMHNNGYLANGKLTWADIFFAGYIENLEEVVREPFINNYSHLKTLREKVYSIPNIKKWIDKRPKTA